MSGRNNRIWKIFFAVFLAAAVIGVSITCIQTYTQNRAEEEMERLAENTIIQEKTEDLQERADSETEQTAPEADAEETIPEDSYIYALTERGIPVPEMEIHFDELQAGVNEDIYAWICIPDTQINYPVLQHPTDNLYYLNYNLDGSRGYPGCIYTENYNAKDFSDPNTVIYGHNMKNGTMFAGLHRFEDSEYFEEHPYIYVFTEERLYVYEIFAAYESGNEHILYNHDFLNNYIYKQYLEEIFENRTMNGNIRDDLTVTTEDRILTLSTCVANKADRRYLVQGVLLEEDSGAENTAGRVLSDEN